MKILIFRVQTLSQTACTADYPQPCRLLFNKSESLFYPQKRRLIIPVTDQADDDGECQRHRRFQDHHLPELCVDPKLPGQRGGYQNADKMKAVQSIGYPA